jgi:hypothetical protein
MKSIPSFFFFAFSSKVFVKKGHNSPRAAESQTDDFYQGYKIKEREKKTINLARLKREMSKYILYINKHSEDLIQISFDVWNFGFLNLNLFCSFQIDICQSAAEVVLFIRYLLSLVDLPRRHIFKLMTASLVYIAHFGFGSSYLRTDNSGIKSALLKTINAMKVDRAD